MDIEEAFHVVGGFGSHQKLIVILLATVANFMSAGQSVGMAMLGSEPKFFCKVGDTEKFNRGCGSVMPVNCTKCGDCTEFEFQDDFTSIVSEWSLICGDAYKTGFIQSFYMMGVFIGAILFGRMSDSFGRLSAIYVSAGAMIVFASVSCFSSSYEMFALIKFLCGLCNGGYGMIVTVYLCELVGPDYRAFTGTLTNIAFAVGIMILAVFAYFVRQWRTLIAWVSFPFFLGIAFYWLLPESPRWLYSKGRTVEAQEVLQHLAEKNRGRKCEIKLKPVGSKHDKVTKAQHSFMDLFSHPVMRQRMFIQTYVWCVNSFVYYGLTLGAGSLGSNRYVALAMSGFVEIPIMLVTLPLLNRLGRRPVLSGGMVLAGISCFLILILPPGKRAHLFSIALVYIVGYLGTKTMFSLIGKMFIASSFNSVFIHSSELIPTEVRAVGISICSMAARVGSIAAPLVAPLDTLYPSLQFMVYCILAVSGGILNLKQPETLGKPMPETFEDLNRLLHLSL